MVEHKDVVVAILGVSAGLGGLVLVFLGLVVGAVSGFQPGTNPAVLQPYRRSGLTVMAAFLLSLVCSALATAWLLNPCQGWLYNVVVGLFFAQLALVAGAATHVFYRILWGN